MLDTIGTISQTAFLALQTTVPLASILRQDQRMDNSDPVGHVGNADAKSKNIRGIHAGPLQEFTRLEVLETIRLTQSHPAHRPTAHANTTTSRFDFDIL